VTEQFILATANPDKVREITAVLAGAGVDIELLPRPTTVPEVDETGETLEENARLKAEALCLATGLPAIADDTGLEVDALGGAPGVYSSRYAGDDATYADNVEKLLRELAGVPAERRTARFRTVCVAAWPDGTELCADGVLQGTITEVPRGTNGFGYDPVFVPKGETRTYAELTDAEKNAISHRARAVRALRGLLPGS
jgi:XTP/dITP diphosphohydrolase